MREPTRARRSASSTLPVAKATLVSLALPIVAAVLVNFFAAVDLVVSVARHWVTVLRRLGVPRVIAIPNPVDLARLRPLYRAYCTKWEAKDRATMTVLHIEHDDSAEWNRIDPQGPR